MRDNNTLPQELIDAITDNLQDVRDRDALLACSLVRSSWRRSSQRLLFRRAYLALDRDDYKRLAQTLLSYPHLSNYFRELQVCWYDYRSYEDRKSRIEAHQAMDQSLFAAVLRKLGNLQTIILYRLDWSLMTVDLRQSLRWVLMLPSITFLTLDITRDESNPVDFFQPLALEDQGENDESRPALERRQLSDLNLCLGSAGNCDAYVDWFLEPRSRFDVSHIQILRVAGLREVDEQALNHLLHTIGSSLIYLGFRVPIKVDLSSPELGFDIKFTPNIRFLCLTNISIGLGDSEMHLETFGMDWLLRLLSNLGTSNKLEQIKLEALIGTKYREACSPSRWGQIDRLLAGNFRKLQTLDITLWATWADRQNAYSGISKGIRKAHPLLVKRGVSVYVGCGDYEFEGMEQF
ncbi:hypothetical protein JB92DRAFT_2903521 [Gautieria morchelliformis]|nr:hypothetical protein JB92DRAFT_2903521 [Gautieria morchelliformis]